MKHLMSLLAVVLFSIAAVGCTAESVCDQYCDKVDECTGSTNAATCKEGYANSAAAGVDFTETCQTALDALNAEGGCAAGDDDDSAS
jgi:hypothetical protein